MAGPENTFKKYLIRIMGNRWDVQSHEDRYSPGIPDLSYGAGGIGGWIELKYIPEGHRKPGKYTPEQVNWLVRRNKYAGNCWVFVKKGKSTYILYPSEAARGIRSGEDVEVLIAGQWEGSIDPDQLLYILTRGQTPRGCV